MSNIKAAEMTCSAYNYLEWLSCYWCDSSVKTKHTSEQKNNCLDKFTRSA